MSCNENWYNILCILLLIIIHSKNYIHYNTPTFCCPCPEGAVVIDDVVESQGDDEERAVTGSVHLEGHVALLQPHCLALFGHGRLKQLPRHLGAKMESVNVAKRLQKAPCNQRAPGLIPAMANIASEAMCLESLTESFNLHSLMFLFSPQASIKETLI